MTVVETVGWVLLHFIWQGAAVAAALAVTLWLTSAAWATTRYTLGCAALLLMLLAPIVTAGRLMGTAQTSEASEPFTAPAARAGVPEADAAGPALTPSRVHRAATPTGSGARMPAALPSAALAAALPWLVVVWAAGVTLLSIRLAGGWWRTRALRVEGLSAAAPFCEALLEQLIARMRIARPVALAVSVRVSVPVVLGHVRPIVLMPAAALSGLSIAQLEAVLAHELAHVRRHDYLVNLVQTVIETVLFYHPAVWWVSRQVRLAREHCCDDLAVAACGDRRSYVEALLGLEQLRHPGALLALGMADGPLVARARRLLAQAESQAASPRLAASAIALTVVGLAIAGVSTASEKPAQADPVTMEKPASGEAHDEASAAAQGGQAAAGAQPVSVTSAPDASAPLVNRWAWAEREARAKQAARYWIGYSISPVATLPSLVYIDRTGTIVGDHMSFRGHFFGSGRDGLTFPGRRLEIPGTGAPAIKLLFALDTSGSTPRLTALHGSTLPLPVDLDDRPVFWLGSADTTQSLEHADALYGRASNPDIKKDLVVAVGVHDASPAVVAWLERRVAGSDVEDVRAEATEWIAWHPIQASLSALDRIARTDRASRVRQEAAEALGDLALPEATTTLVALARSLTDTDARQEAVEALGARPELAARDALGAIARQDAKVDIQREAVETLGDYKDQRGVPLLIELAKTHPNRDVRREAVETLGDALPKETVVPLLKQLALDDPDPGVQEEAVDTLAAVDHESGLATLMELARSHPRSEVRREAVEALGHRAPASDEGKNDAAATRDRTAIVDLLASLSDSDRDPAVQIEAVETLGELPDQAGRDRLRILAQTHAKPEVRREAIETLVEHAKASEVIVLLREIVQKDKDESVRLEAVERLAEVDDPEARKTLGELARTHPDERIRAEAVESLGHAAPAAQSADLLKGIALNDTAARVRGEALETLSELPDGAGTPALIELARAHRDEQSRAEAVESLGHAVPAAQSADVLKGIALKDAAARVRDEALETLSELPDGAGVPALIELARSHPDAATRKQALEALLESEHPRAREVFERALKPPND